MLSRRPPWLPPDYHPQDLEQGWRCLLQQFNPNDNATPASQLLYHNKFGILKSLLLSRSDPGEQTTFGEQVPLGLQSAGRLQQHRLLQVSDFAVGRRLATSVSLPPTVLSPKRLRSSHNSNILSPKRLQPPQQ